MKILMIGQSVEDHIYENGKITIKPGGIYYSAAALLNVAEKEDVISLCTSIVKGKDHLFEKVYGLAEKTFFNYSDAIPVVNLTIHEDKEREERYENLNQPLEIDTERLGSYDGIYINMVTGFDISIEQLEDIRSKFKGPIYIDIHTLSRGYGENGNRIFRLIPEAERWIKSVDIIQVNEHELFTLNEKTDEKEIIKNVLDSGVQYLIVTKGDKGARIFYRENNEISSIFISAIKINALNKVGCGDVFGAIYFYFYMKLKNIIAALRIAVAAAGFTSSYSYDDQFSKIKDDIQSRNN